MGYTFDTDEDTETRRRRRRQSIADLLMKNADAAPIQSPWQGAAKMASAGISGFLLGREEKRDREMAESRNAYGSKLSEELAGFGGGGGGGGSPVTAALAGKPMGGPIKLGGFEPTLGRTLEFEGGVNPRDTNGTPSVHGINQKANPDVDLERVKTDPAYRAEIYRQRYWNTIDGDKLDPRVAHVAFDTSVIAGPGKARELLKASGGDPEKFLALREAFQNRLLAANPEKYGPYAKAWANRTATLRSDVGVGGGGQPGGMMAVGGGAGDTTLAGGDTLQGRGMPDANRLMQIATDRNAPPEIRERAKLMLQSMPKPRDPLQEEAARLTIEEKRRNLSKPLIDPTATEREYERAKREGFKGDIFEFKREIAKAGASNTNLNTNPGPSKQVYDSVEKQADTARAAAAALPSFAEAKRLVDSGSITLGAGADTRVALQKFGALFGMDATSASNAELFKSVVAPQVFALIKNLGAGSGISNNDLKFAEKAAGGDINLEPATLRRLMNLGERAARLGIERHQKMLDEVYPESDPQNRQVRSLFRVDPSAYTLPEVQAAEPATMPPPAAAAPKGGGEWQVIDGVKVRQK